MTQPSKFIFNSDYATLKNDAQNTYNVVIPPTFNVPFNPSSPFYVVNQEFNIGQKAAGMRFAVKSSKYPGRVLVTPTYFTIPATVSYGGQSNPSLLYGSIFRSAPGKVKLIIVAGYALTPTTATFSDCGQTLTISIATYLSPFSS